VTQLTEATEGKFCVEKNMLTIVSNND